MRELGLEDGKRLILHVRDAKGDLKAVEAAARDLEAQNVDLIHSWSTSVSLAVVRATKKVPIIFYAGTDPVAVGLVGNFRKPGGRVTGMHGWTTDLTGKRLALLREMIPSLRRVVTFYNPQNPAAQEAVKLARDAARQLKVELVEHRVASVEQLRTVLGALRPGEADAYLHVSDSMMTSQVALVVETAMAKRLATMFQDKQSVIQGGLASYGVDYYAAGRPSANRVQRMLLGANPGDLAVEQLDRRPLRRQCEDGQSARPHAPAIGTGAGRRNHPVTYKAYAVSWNLTQRCNLFCAHCYISGGPGASAAGELSTEECRRVMADIARVNPGTFLILTGGSRCSALTFSS